MQAVILAAGYGTRLYPLTKDVPKPLLEVQGKAILAYLLEQLREIPLSQIFLVTNAPFVPLFSSWLEHYFKSHLPLPVVLLNDGTNNNDDRLGAIGDLDLALRQSGNEETLVLAGDNMLGFPLTEFVRFFQEKRRSIVAFRDLRDKEKVRKRYGVGQLEGTQVVQFQEKPEDPCSALAATACYLLPQKDLWHIPEVIRLGQADNLGNLMVRLVQLSEVHGFVFQGHWFDVGDFSSLEEARRTSLG